MNKNCGGLVDKFIDQKSKLLLLSAVLDIAFFLKKKNKV